MRDSEALRFRENAPLHRRQGRPKRLRIPEKRRELLIGEMKDRVDRVEVELAERTGPFGGIVVQHHRSARRVQGIHVRAASKMAEPERLDGAPE